MRTVRVFISSPRDAEQERLRAQRAIERINAALQGQVQLIPIRWETSFYSAHETFQNQIPEAAECDIVVGIFKRRLGTTLPESFPKRMSDGRPFASGSAYEVLSAIDARHNGKKLPDIFVFREAKPQWDGISLEDRESLDDAIEQWGRLKGFFEEWFVKDGAFVAAFQPFADAENFEEQVERLLRDWLKKNVLKGTNEVWPIERLGSPFRGLAPFGATHAQVFFGRSRETARAIERLKETARSGMPFLLITGASGTGKSSLARAGIVPRLTAPGAVAEVDRWRIAETRAGDRNPCEALSTSLFQNVEEIGTTQGPHKALPELRESDVATPTELAALFQHGDETVVPPILGALDAASRSAAAELKADKPLATRLLIVVDQLDDLFEPGIAEAERQAFVNTLATLLATGRVWVIATLRATYYERFLREPVLAGLKERGASLDLSPPDLASLAEIVREPARAANLSYETDPATGESLDECLLRDAGTADILPLLQFSLQRLFDLRLIEGDRKILTFAAYRSFAGIDGAIDQAAEEALLRLGRPAAKLLPTLLRRLCVVVEEAGGSSLFALRPYPLTEIPESSPLRQLVNSFAESRILVISAEGARLAHLRVLDAWRRAKQIVQTNADFFRTVNDVREQLRRWVASSGHPSTLLPRGRPLMDARDLANAHGSELDDGTRGFIAMSRHRSRFAMIHVVGWLALVVMALFFDQLKTKWPEAANSLALCVFFVVYPAVLLANQSLYARHFRRTVRDWRKIAAGTEDRLGVLRFHQLAILVSWTTACAALAYLAGYILYGYTVRAWDGDAAIDGLLTLPVIPCFILVLTAHNIPGWLVSYRVTQKFTAQSGPLTFQQRWRPVVVLAILGVMSGLISNWAVPSVSPLDFLGRMGAPVFYVPGIAFGGVLAFAEYTWGERTYRAAAQAAVGTVLAWCIAYSSARWVGPATGLLGLWIAPLFGGMIGAVITAGSVSALNGSMRAKVNATALGTLLGLLFAIPNYGQYLLYPVWQSALAAYVGYRMRRGIAHEA